MKRLVVLVALVAGIFGQAGPAATHGMLIFGKSQIYLSPLPMFHRPHDYQAIFHVSLPVDVEAAFVEDERQHPEQTVYTLVPQAFSLPELAVRPFPFQATIYRGHFERGGTPILSGV